MLYIRYIHNVKHLSQVVLRKKIFYIFYVFSFSKPGPPGVDHFEPWGHYLNQPMLHTIFQAAERSGSKKIFLYFFSKADPLGRGHFR